MNYADAVRIIKDEAKITEGANPDIIDGRVRTAIGNALSMVWDHADWHFTIKTDTMSIAASDDTYDLPSDCDGITSLRHTQNDTGTTLIEMGKEEFDVDFPNPSFHAEDVPRIYAVFWNAQKRVLQVQLFPIPNGAMTLYRRYKVTIDETDWGAFPSTFHPVLIAACRFQFHPNGTASKQSAAIDYGQALAVRMKKSGAITRRRNQLIRPDVRRVSSIDPGAWQDPYRVRGRY